MTDTITREPCLPKSNRPRHYRHASASRRMVQVWHHFARVISETGRSPAYRQVADAIISNEDSVKVSVKHLTEDGFLRIEGSHHRAVVHVLKWPEGITPRETIGRTDRADTGKAPPRAPVKYEQPAIMRQAKVTTAHRQPDLERGPKTCATPSCRYPKQPGREHCASCLNTRMPERMRADMVESMFVGGVANS